MNNRALDAPKGPSIASGECSTESTSYVHACGHVGKLLDGMPLGICNGCDGCGNRCTSGVPMTRAEFDAIEAYLERNALPARPPQGPDIETDPVWGQVCRFRDGLVGRCAIYPVRPLICRLMGHVWWLPCPIERVGRSASVQDVTMALMEYCRLERFPYEHWARIDEA